MFAAVVLLIIGVFQVIIGIAAIGQDVLFVTNTDYVYYFNTTAWGWIHLALGVLLILCAIGLFARAAWAMMAGIFLAVLSAIDNFFFLPFYPLWSLVIIALNIFVIWSLATLLSAHDTGRHGIADTGRHSTADTGRHSTTSDEGRHSAPA